MAAPVIPIVAGDHLLLRIGYYFLNQAAYNILHYRVMDFVGASSVDLQVLCETISSFAEGKVKDCLSAQASLIGFGLSRIAPEEPTIEAVDKSDGGLGTVAGDAMPRQASGIITKQTTLPGRRFRGRVYVPFPGEASGDANGTPNATYLTALDNFAQALLITNSIAPPGMTSLNLEPLLQHRLSEGVPIDPPTYTPLTWYTVRDKWATQRRRGSYGKENAIPFGG